MDFESFHDESYITIGYHSKGYYFEFEDEAELIVGSSNITRYALLKNVEWDLVIRDKKDSDVFGQMLEEFHSKWSDTYFLDRELIGKYINKLNYAIEHNRYRVMGMRRALIVAAAGSGKTYLAAFDARISAI